MNCGQNLLHEFSINFLKIFFFKDLCVSQICMTFQNNIMAISLMLCYYSKLYHSRSLMCA